MSAVCNWGAFAINCPIKPLSLQLAPEIACSQPSWLLQSKIESRLGFTKSTTDVREPVCEQQMRRLPSAGLSSGSGCVRYPRPLKTNPLSQFVTNTPVRHDQRTGDVAGPRPAPRMLWEGPPPSSVQQCHLRAKKDHGTSVGVLVGADAGARAAAPNDTPGRH